MQVERIKSKIVYNLIPLIQIFAHSFQANFIKEK